MTVPDPNVPEPGPDASVDDIRADIDATRHELGQTVEALTAKLDVKQQAKDKVEATVEDTKTLLVDKADALRERGFDVGAPVAALALLAVIVGVLVWLRRQ